MQTLTDRPNIFDDLPGDNELAAIYILRRPESIATKILHDAKITQLPVNLYQIADFLKITISENENLDNTIGVATETDDRIILNPKLNNPRFALALILGDAFCRRIILKHFHWPKNQYTWTKALLAYNLSMSPKQFIKMQNHIALAILMPKQQFMEKYNSGEPYENIAADFDVTDEDFGHRLDTLNI